MVEIKRTYNIAQAAVVLGIKKDSLWSLVKGTRRLLPEPAYQLTPRRKVYDEGGLKELAQLLARLRAVGRIRI